MVLNSFNRVGKKVYQLLKWEKCGIQTILYVIVHCTYSVPYGKLQNQKWDRSVACKGVGAFEKTKLKYVHFSLQIILIYKLNLISLDFHYYNLYVP